MARTEKVVVVVVEREGFNGRFRAGKFWPTGKTVAEVTRAEFDILKSDPMLAVAVADDEDEITPAEGSTGTGPTLAEAQAMLDEIKRLQGELATVKASIRAAAASPSTPPAEPTTPAPAQPPTGEGLSTGKPQPQGGRGR